MRASLALLGVAFAVGLAGCGSSKEEQARKIARLERDLRQAQAAEAIMQAMRLETRTSDFDKPISDAELKAKDEEIEARQKRIRELTKQVDAVKATKAE